jgi:ABC-2 type transport system permease protein
VSVPVHSRLRATTRSEWIKFSSVRSGPVVLLTTAAVLLVGAWLLGAAERDNYAALPPAGKAAFDPVFAVLRGIELAQLFVGALGVTTVTGEYTSGLIRGTFVATPQRARVLAVKALVFALVVGVGCTVLSFAAFLLGQRVLGPAKHVGIADPGVLAAVVGGGVYLTLAGLLGVFLAVLLRRTPASLAVLFGLLVVLPIVFIEIPGRISARLGEYMPGTAGEQGFHLVHGGAYTLGPGQGLGVLAGYVAVAGIAAFALVLRRDA